ncbi:MAG: hypothetical protein IJS99_00115 [Synergistaceae bacterium]|nr:hypothetical protein [Synergistaceae bacterium]
MRKIFCAAFIIALILSLAGMSCANDNEKNIQAWDLDKMIHPELKKDFSKANKQIITPENINDVREFFAKLRSFPPKDPAVDIDDEVLNKGFCPQSLHA